MQRQPVRICALLLLPVLVGCDTRGAQGREQDPGATPGARAQPAAEPARSARLLGREDVRGDGCPLLPRDDVAATVGIDAGAVRPNPALDCLYAWDGGGAMLGNIRVHGSFAGARRDFADTTQDLAAAEMQAGAADLRRRLEAEAADGRIDDRQAEVGGDLAAAMSNDDVVNTAVEGVGELASHDGNRLKVLVGNVTFDLAADSGDEFDVALSRDMARRVVRNLERL